MNFLNKIFNIQIVYGTLLSSQTISPTFLAYIVTTVFTHLAIMHKHTNMVLWCFKDRHGIQYCTMYIILMYRRNMTKQGFHTD